MAEEVSSLVTDNLWQANIRDYPKNQLVKVADSYSPQSLINEKASVDRFTLWVKDLLIGTIGLHKTPFDNRIPSHYVFGVFVRISHHSQGIGQSLTKYIENYAFNLRIRKLVTSSSITARDFYLKYGYEPDNDGDDFNSTNNTYTLAKWLI